MKQPIDCPVDFVVINENQARLNAGLVIILMAVWSAFTSPVIIFFLSLDFLARALNLGKYSLLNLISGVIVKILNMPFKPTDRAPKRFAAAVGFVFCCAIFFTSLFKLVLATWVLAGILLLFASLESLAGICAGCYVYSYIWKPLLKK